MNKNNPHHPSTEDIFIKECKIKDGIYHFIDISNLTGDNLKFAKLYNKFSRLYHLYGRIFYWLKFGGEKSLEKIS